MFIMQFYLVSVVLNLKNNQAHFSSDNYVVRMFLILDKVNMDEKIFHCFVQVFVFLYILTGLVASLEISYISIPILVGLFGHYFPFQ